MDHRTGEKLHLKPHEKEITMSEKKRKNLILSRTFNGELEDLGESCLSNALLVGELVIMLPNVLIKIILTKVRNQLDGTRNKM